MPQVDVRDTMPDCPRCHGEGRILKMIAGTTNVGEHVCPKCNGEGKVVGLPGVGAVIKVMKILTGG